MFTCYDINRGEVMKIVKCKNGNISIVLKEVEDVSEKVIKSNSVDAAFEKHVPMYEINDNKVSIYVDHVMEEDHYIEWIMVDYGDSYFIKEFKPGDEPKVIVDYKTGMKAYSYCNKHSLWVCEDIK